MNTIYSNKWLVIFTVVILGLIATYVLWQQIGPRASAKEIANAKLYSGQATLLRETSKKPLTSNSKIQVGDIIETSENSRLALELKDGSVVRLEAGSKVKIKEAVFNSENKITNVELELLEGKMWNKVEPLGDGAKYQTETPVMVAAVRGTQYNLEHFGLRSVLLVFSGKVFGSMPPASEQIVTPGNTLVVDKSNGTGETPTQRPQQPGEVDDWIQFNLTEDKKLETSNQEAETPLRDPDPAPGQNPPPPPSTSSGPTAPPPPAQPVPPPPTTTAKPKSLTITPTKTNLNVGETILFTTELTYDDGTKYKPTTGVTWQQTNEIGAFQNNYYRGILAGSTSIKATFGGITSNSVAIQISDQATTSSLAIACTKRQNPNNPNGLPQAYCTAYYNPGQQNVTANAQWQVSGSSAGSISGGVYTPEATGSATITATYNGVSGQTTIKIP